MVEMVLVEISLTTLTILDTALVDTRGQFSEFWQTLLLEKRKILILEPWNSSSRNEAGRHDQGKGQLQIKHTVVLDPLYI
jgi:hypothetical protein